jgi:thiol-disulfide isomerase/thioredoxin
VGKWKKWGKELAAMAVVTVIAASVIGYLRAPSYEDATLPEVHISKLGGLAYNSTVKPEEPYILHFWATWCPTCRAEAGNIEAVSKEHHVITVAVKSGGLDSISKYKRENGLTFPVINDENGVMAKAFHIGVFPTTIIVGKDGKVFWAETGYTTTWGLKLRLWLAGVLSRP